MSNSHQNPSSPEVEEMLQKIKAMPAKHRIELTRKLLGSELGTNELTAILGGNNVSNNLFAVQLNSNEKTIEKLLDKLPPEVLGSLVQVLANYLENNNLEKDC